MRHGKFRFCSLAGAIIFAASVSSPVNAFNFEAECEGIIISYKALGEAAIAIAQLNSPSLSDFQRQDGLLGVGENNLSRYFGKNIAEMNDADIDAVGNRFAACVNNWPGNFPLQTSKEAVLATVEADLDAIRRINQETLARSKAATAERLAAEELSRTQSEQQATEEAARIEELTRKVEEAEAAKSRAEELTERRKDLEERLAKANEVTPEPADETNNLVDESDASSGEPEQHVATEAEKLQQLAAYFQQFSIATHCSRVNVNFSSADIAGIEAKIKTAIGTANVDLAKARETWERISRIINSNSGKLTQADCDQAYQWFTYVLPSVQLGTPSDFPFE